MKITRASRRALIIPTALFVAMFVMLLCTALFASVSYNLSLSLESLDATERRYLSFGAMNELLSKLNSGEVQATTYTRGHPWQVNTNGTVSECWVEPLSGQNVLVVAQTSRHGQGRPEVVKSLCTYHEFDAGRVYTNVVDDNPGVPDHLFYSDDSAGGSWSELPAPTRQRYLPDGTLETRAGEFAGTLPFVAGAPNGSVYSIYSPAVDGWDDPFSPAHFGIIIPISMPWGQLTRGAIVTGNRNGMTVGDLAPAEQTLIDHVVEVTISKGAVPLKYSHDTGQWEPLPPPQEATVDNSGNVHVDAGNYHIQGVNGPPTAYNGGIIAPMFRNGRDAIYDFREDTQQWNILVPKQKDVVLMTADVEDGTPYVQSGEVQPVTWVYFAQVLAAVELNIPSLLDNIEADIASPKLHKWENNDWVPVPDPPAEFFKRSGPQLDTANLGPRGLRLGGMVASGGELTVVSRPPNGSNLVDTLWKYRQGKWEVVPPPPNKRYDPITGNAVDVPGLPSRLEVGMGANGNLILRIPTRVGPNPIFMQTKGGSYDLLPPVKSSAGVLQPFLCQSSGGRKQSVSGHGAYVVRATYF